MERKTDEESKERKNNKKEETAKIKIKYRMKRG